MQLDYEHCPDKVFSHWVNYETKNNDIMFIMDVNAWISEQCGELGVAWGYETIRGAAPTGGALWNFRNPPMVNHSWRFKDKADAMLFKLTWDGK